MLPDMPASRPVTRAPETLTQQVGDDYVVVDTRTQQAHALTGPVARAWEQLEAGQPVADAAALAQLVDAELVATRGVTRRSMLARAGVVAAGAGIVSIGLPMASAAATGQAITRTPTTGPVGTVVSVSGTGFPANSLITITYDGVTMTTIPAAPTTDGSGSFTNVQFTVPASTAGNHVIAAIAGAQSATTTFTVTPQVTSNPSSLTRNAGIGGAGLSVTLTGTGFAPNSAITFTRGGDFTSATFPAGITTNAQGSFTATVTGIHYPNGSGSGTITATDAASNSATVTIPH